MGKTAQLICFDTTSQLDIDSDDNSSSYTSLETDETYFIDGDPVHRISPSGHCVSYSTIDSFTEDLKTDSCACLQLADRSRNSRFLKMSSRFSNDELTLLCESDDLLFIFGVTEDETGLTPQFHFFLKQTPLDKKHQLQHNMVGILSRLDPVSDDDDRILRPQAEQLLLRILGFVQNTIAGIDREN
jgi:hypothetical protein